MSDEEEPASAEERATAQNLYTDVRRMIAPFFGGQAFHSNPGTAFHKTTFDGFDLNAMVDMVRHAKPDDLELVGEALDKAADEIDSVGKDLNTHIGKVDWDGQSGDSFRKWGGDLANNTLKLGDYTRNSSTQIKAAGMGLAMVMSSMPPKDDGGPGAAVSDIPKADRVDSNKDYTKALQTDAAKREEIRQEAILQMNKLSSYYQVSHDTMYAQQEPRFKPMPDVGMPPPPRVDPRQSGGLGDTTSPVSPGGGPGTYSGTSNIDGFTSESSRVVPEGGSSQHGRTLEPEVRTEIDSVTTTPPAPPADGGTRQVPPPVNNSPNNTGPSFGPPGPMNTTKNPNLNKPPGPTRSVGNSPGPNNSRTGSGPGSNPGGRQNSTMPPRGGRPPGITGGTQSQTGPRNTPRIPRGNVIGGEHGPMGRGGMGGMRGGMGMGSGMGSGSGMGNGAPSRRLTSSPGGVVGNPRAASSMRSGAPRAFTPGGTGLVRGGAGSQNSARMMPRSSTPSRRDPSREESERPDYLVEDEETWTAGRTDIVPPVIE